MPFSNVSLTEGSGTHIATQTVSGGSHVQFIAVTDPASSEPHVLRIDPIYGASVSLKNVLGVVAMGTNLAASSLPVVLASNHGNVPVSIATTVGVSALNTVSAYITNTPNVGLTGTIGVSGGVAVNNFPTSFQVSNTVAVSALNTHPVYVSNTVAVSALNTHSAYVTNTVGVSALNTHPVYVLGTVGVSGHVSVGNTVQADIHGPFGIEVADNSLSVVICSDQAAVPVTQYQSSSWSVSTSGTLPRQVVVTNTPNVAITTTVSISGGVAVGNFPTSFQVSNTVGVSALNTHPVYISNTPSVSQSGLWTVSTSGTAPRQVVVVNIPNVDIATLPLPVVFDPLGNSEMNNSVSVTMAYDQTPIDVSQGDVFNVGLTSSGTGFSTACFTALTGTATALSNAAGKLSGYALLNTNSIPVYLQIFDSAGAIVVGTTAPSMIFPIPCNSTAVNGVLSHPFWDVGLNIVSGIRVAITTSPNGSGAPATGCAGTIMFR